MAPAGGGFIIVMPAVVTGAAARPVHLYHSPEVLFLDGTGHLAGISPAELVDGGSLFIGVLVSLGKIGHMATVVIGISLGLRRVQPAVLFCPRQPRPPATLERTDRLADINSAR